MTSTPKSGHKLDLPALSHHAYCLIGSFGIVELLVNNLRDVHKLSIHNNPDFHSHSFENFTIDDARELKLSHENKATSIEGKKIFILDIKAITIEAQNALLKLLEEPSVGSHFFLIVPSISLLLPTVLSRMLVVETNHVSDNLKAEDGEAQAFLTLSLPKRLEIVKSIADDLTKEKRTKQSVIDFLDSIQALVYKKEGATKGLRMLEAIELARKYAGDRAPSLKMLLEYVALNV